MKNLLIKNKLFSIKGNSTVKDEEGNDVLTVKGAFFSLTRRKRLYDMDGNLLFKIRNKLIKLFMNSCYIYDSHGKKIARIKQKLKLFKKHYVFKSFKEEIEIKGDFIEHRLRFYRDGNEIGEVGRRYLTLSDTFVLACYNDEDIPLLVALVIAIDNIADNRADTMN